MGEQFREAAHSCTPRTWGENVWPTATQLADWLKVCTDAERITFATLAIRDGQAHDACMVQHAPPLSPEQQVRNVQAWLREVGFKNTAARLETLITPPTSGGAQ